MSTHAAVRRLAADLGVTPEQMIAWAAVERAARERAARAVPPLVLVGQGDFQRAPKIVPNLSLTRHK